MKGYFQGVPRRFSTFEFESHQRLDLEKRAIKSQLWQNDFGQIMGAIIVLLSLITTGWMGSIGNTVLATALGTTTVVSLATIYFLGKRMQQSKKGTQSPKS